ncbi:MAG: VanZ family protein [Deferribacteres bacterium]|nr:VanZ family protein [Deferribacteres bacterium]
MSVRWFLAGILLQILIIATLPVAPRIPFACYRFLGKGECFLFFNLLVFAFILAAVFYAVRARRFYLIFLLALSSLCLFAYPMLPTERFHFAEYMMLGFIYRRAFKKGYFFPVLFVFMGSVFDEYVQLLLPNRFFDVKDIFWNLVGGLVGIWLKGL